MKDKSFIDWIEERILQLETAYKRETDERIKISFSAKMVALREARKQYAIMEGLDVNFKTTL